MVNAMKAFEQELIAAADQRASLKFYIDQFGKHGPQADFRWMVADVDTLLASPFVRPRVASEKPKEKEFGKRQLLACELLVRKCLSDRSFLQRYYRAVIWSGLWLGTGKKHAASMLSQIQGTRDGFKDHPEEYWWYARNFVLLAYATGREDILDRADAEKLQPRFVEWFEWFNSKDGEAYLQADAEHFRWSIDKKRERNSEGVPPLQAPKEPFSDWKGPSAPDPRLLEALGL
jgi:hypothetical protein